MEIADVNERLQLRLPVQRVSPSIYPWLLSCVRRTVIFMMAAFLNRSLFYLPSYA